MISSMLVALAGTTLASSIALAGGPGGGDDAEASRRVRLPGQAGIRVRTGPAIKGVGHSMQGTRRFGGASAGIGSPMRGGDRAETAGSSVFGGDELERRWFTPQPGVRELSGRLLVMPLAAGQDAGASSASARTSLKQAEDRIADLRIGRVAGSGMSVIRTPRGTSDVEMARSLLATGDYAFVVPDWRVMPVSDGVDSDDPQRPRQWHLDRIGITQAWSVSTGGGPITIAFVDTGVDTDHPDLSPLLVGGYNSVDRITQGQGGQIEDLNGHGTSVIGTAAAQGNNQEGVSGIGWELAIMPVRASNSPGGGAFYSDILDGIAWATAHGADIISVSYGGVETPATEAMGLAVMNNGGLLVWAAGNMATQGSFDHPHVIVVSGTQNDDTLYPPSNFGPGIDLAAPAKGIRTTRRGGDYGTFAGTSYASPIVAGVAALVWSCEPDLTAAQVRSRLYQSAIDLGEPGQDMKFGRGLIDAAGAMSDAPPPPPPPPPGPKTDRRGDDSGSMGKTCPADLTGSANASAAGYGVPDGLVDGSDYAYYLAQFTAGNLAVADLGSSGDGAGMVDGPDGKLDSTDFFVYLDRFTQGCGSSVATSVR